MWWKTRPEVNRLVDRMTVSALQEIKSYGMAAGLRNANHQLQLNKKRQLWVPLALGFFSVAAVWDRGPDLEDILTGIALFIAGVLAMTAYQIWSFAKIEGYGRAIAALQNRIDSDDDAKIAFSEDSFQLRIDDLRAELAHFLKGAAALEQRGDFYGAEKYRAEARLVESQLRQLGA